MTSNHNWPRKKHYRATDVHSIRRETENGERNSISPTRLDAYVTAWGFAGVFATIGLCKLVGPVALVVATIIAALAASKLTRAARQFPRRVWFYWWVALLSTGIGLAVFEAHTMSVPIPALRPDGILR